MTTEPNQQTEKLLLANLQQVLNERDPARRLEALAALWTHDARMLEAEASFDGLPAVSDNVGAIQKRLPAGSRFHPAGPVIVNHDAALLRWAVGPDPEHPVVTGTDIAFVEGGKIRELYVFLDRH